MSEIDEKILEATGLGKKRVDVRRAGTKKKKKQRKRYDFLSLVNTRFKTLLDTF